MNVEEIIKNKLREHINLVHLDLRDTTGKHIHHQNFDGGLHLSATIVSDNFNNKSLLERHQLVYKALGSMVKNQIHAFSMKTYTPEEWRANIP
ncbi:MAG: BolA family protein [Candidatus Marinimicrobia bacterium]|nr:BolA family protein [Candidatus Neomarinimicrobiota bacterium]